MTLLSRTVVFLLAVTFPIAGLAGEGMWLLTQLDQLDLKGKGFEVTAQEIYSPTDGCLLDAIVNMGGASGAFVSDKGLILTNHHVAFGAIQRASTGGTDYLKSGFSAGSMTEEIMAPGSYARVIIEIRDVTEEVLAAGKKSKNAVTHKRMIGTKISELVEAEEAGGEDIQAKIAELYEGGKYEMYVYKRLNDIRIVFAPPQSIGNYGSEIDNWMWPRHTGDFTFLRAYIGPDGVGREYSPENVPFEPKRWLKISTGDLDPEDLTFIVGFPGKTNRYATHHRVQESRDLTYPYAIEHNQFLIDLIEGASDGSDLAGIKIAGRTRGLYNGMKNYKGVVKGMYSSSFLEERIAFDEALQEFVKSDRKLKKRYGKVLEKIGKIYEEKQERIEKNRVMSMFGWYGAMPLSRAISAYNTAKERELPLDKRDPAFSETDIDNYQRYYRFGYLNVFEPFERVLMTHTFELASNLPQGERIKAVDDLLAEAGSIEAAVDALFDGTQMMDGSFAVPLFDKPSSEIEAFDDPMLKFAIAFYPEKFEYDEAKDKIDAELQELRRLYLEMIKAKEGTRYPDATGTVRMTYGPVRGYDPCDAVTYAPFTTLTGVLEKDTGIWPFNMPAKLRELCETGEHGIWADPDLEDVPVAFTHINDITGGNSGSPVMNASGEMIGIAFDGNFEALLGDWKFESSINRTISVDTRYVMFVTQKFAGLDWLIQEMDLPADSE